MNLRFDISAGELFEMIRPAMLFVAALLSSLVLLHARKRFGNLTALAWALATFVFPPVVLPFYIAVLVWKRPGVPAVRRIAHTIAIPTIYLLALFAFISVYVLHDSASADLHLARATQAKLAGNRQRVIAEYRLALAAEDNAHTHKLLANELAETGYLTEALGEFRLAERGGEPDPLIPFRIATLLDMMGYINQAELEYERFLNSGVCLSAPTEPACAGARQRIDAHR